MGKLATNKTYQVKERGEIEDIYDKGWDRVKNLKTDEERMSFCQEVFKNPVPADPSVNLTYHGYKRKALSINENDWHQKSITEHVTPNTFMLKNGVISPLAGNKRTCDTDGKQGSSVRKFVKISEFANVMKREFYLKFCNKFKMEDKERQRDILPRFQTFLSHYKAGHEDTKNFLSFYKNSKESEVKLEDFQAREVLDIENHFSSYSRHYGETEELFCTTCDKRHKFSI